MSLPFGVGHDWGAEHDVIERARRIRARDAALLRGMKAVVKGALLLAIPALLLVIFTPVCTLRWECRGRQSEAKGNLKALYVAEEAYRAEHDHYTADRTSLGFEAKGARLRYHYVVSLHPDGKHFRAAAIGAVSPMVGDMWVIDEANAIEHLVNVCDR